MINFALNIPSIWILKISQILKFFTSSLRILQLALIIINYSSSSSSSSSHPLHTAVWRTATHLLHFCNPGAARLIILKNGAFTSQFQLFFFMIFLTPPPPLSLALWGPQQCVLFVRHVLFISIGVCTDDRYVLLMASVQ